MSLSHLAPEISRRQTLDKPVWIPEFAPLSIAERQAAEARYQKEQSELAKLRRPMAMRTAFRLMGLLLGTFPPAAIFFNLAGYGIAHRGFFDSGPPPDKRFFLFSLGMNIVCAVVGWLMGGVFSSVFGKWSRQSWLTTVLLLPVLGALWGFVTGAFGGAVFYGLGAIAGAYCAIPVGIVGFTAFGLMHRRMQRDGVIGARQLWTLALGITTVISALILCFLP